MKVYAVLLIAALCATAISAQEPEERRLKDVLVSKAKELQGKLSQAIANAKGGEVAKEVAKVLGVKKEQALARVQQLQALLQAKLKELEAKAGPIVEQAKARIQATLKELQAARDKLISKVDHSKA